MPLTEEEVQKLDKLGAGVRGVAAKLEGFDDKFESTDSRIADVVKDVDLIKNRVNAIPVGRMAGEERREKTEFSLLQTMRTLRDPHGKMFDPNSRSDIDKLTHERVMQGNQGVDGGYLIDDEYVATLIPELDSRLVLSQAGARTLQVDKAGNVRWPKETSGPTGHWIGEGTVITESTPQFGQLVASPKKAAALVRVSNDLLNLSNPSAQAIVEQGLIRKLALLIQLGALRGTGSSFQPLGVVNLSGINTVEVGSPNGGPITVGDLQDMQIEVDSDDIDEGGRAWIMHPRMWGQITKLQDNDNRPIVNPDVKERSQNVLFGDPVFRTSQLPTNLAKGSGTNLTEIIYGRFMHMIQVIWSGGVQIELSGSASDGTNHAFPQDETWFRIIMPVDYINEYEQAYALINDAQSGL